MCRFSSFPTGSSNNVKIKQPWKLHKNRKSLKWVCHKWNSNTVDEGYTGLTDYYYESANAYRHIHTHDQYTHNFDNRTLPWSLILFREQFLGMLLPWMSWGFLLRGAPSVRGCYAYLQAGVLPKGGSETWGESEPRHTAEMCSADARLPRRIQCNERGLFEGQLSVLLCWRNWKALDRSPWSPLTFIKGFGLQRKIAGLFLSVCTALVLN